MLGYTNLDSEKGFEYFQRFMKDNGIIDQMKERGLKEGDTVRVGDYLQFEYYD
jgi:GTP-binding protein